MKQRKEAFENQSGTVFMSSHKRAGTLAFWIFHTEEQHHTGEFTDFQMWIEVQCWKSGLLSDWGSLCPPQWPRGDGDVLHRVLLDAGIAFRYCVLFWPPWGSALQSCFRSQQVRCCSIEENEQFLLLHKSTYSSKCRVVFNDYQKG